MQRDEHHLKLKMQKTAEQQAQGHLLNLGAQAKTQLMNKIKNTPMKSPQINTTE